MKAFESWKQTVIANVKVWDERLNNSLPTDVTNSDLTWVLNMGAKEAALTIICRDKLILSAGTRNTFVLSQIIVSYVYGLFANEEVHLASMLELSPNKVTKGDLTIVKTLIEECRKSRAK